MKRLNMAVLALGLFIAHGATAGVTWTTVSFQNASHNEDAVYNRFWFPMTGGVVNVTATNWGGFSSMGPLLGGTYNFDYILRMSTRAGVAFEGFPNPCWSPRITAWGRGTKALSGLANTDDMVSLRVYVNRFDYANDEFTDANGGSYAPGIGTVVVRDMTTGEALQSNTVSGTGVLPEVQMPKSHTAGLEIQSVSDLTGAPVHSLKKLYLECHLQYAKIVNAAPTDILLSGGAVEENQPSGTTAGTLSTTDPDEGDTFTYALADGAGSSNNASFTISGSNLLTAASFNYEAQGSYNIRVRTTDQFGLYCDKAFTIAVQDVNEAPTDVDVAPPPFPLYENQPPGTLAGTFYTTDPDEDTFTYALVAGAGSEDNAYFTISGSDLLTAAVLDFETKMAYSVRVRTTDSGELWYENSLVIYILDVFPEPPGFVEAPSFTPDGKIILRWSSSFADLSYAVHDSTNLMEGFTVLQENIPPTPPMNSFTTTVLGVKQKFWMISTEE